ncbi:hypothetical protein N478_22315 [Pseudoalteromonas luteoviolacea S4060-1]|uniref:Uncharacterized protein n=1 Tax=Pseudoalteromonas luteoviolacea S4060-1 TaxID=1365257 RepID=A0A167LFL8_9GAMM|nr:hypothetical protein N478_22315 [Pseudoalteromonas luteoviolacea S4060-1]
MQKRLDYSLGLGTDSFVSNKAQVDLLNFQKKLKIQLI